MGAKAIIALSGGVDSSVAALLLRKQGYEVEALFMKNWDEPTENGACLWEADVEDAMQACERLDIPLNTIDLSKQYWHGVFDNFLSEYRAGRTPNPDVLCNQEIKFRTFLEQALHLGAEAMATGHYARIRRDKDLNRLLKGSDRYKDQSYFLCRLNQWQLARTLFPVGDMKKPGVRALAKRAGLATHDKKDSTGICFIGERPFRAFLSRYLPSRPGEIRSADGQVIGEHEGVHLYTVGQRQGLKVGGISGRGQAPWYVADKELEQNVLVVVQGRDHPLLYSRGLRATNPHWIDGRVPAGPMRLSAKIRYRQADQKCLVDPIDEQSLHVTFQVPQRAAAPGQYIVFYDGDVCLGSAIIESTIH
ncbi:MAG: tRNA 2-thiouridine(34) synthase MnmA [Gammaproteobacteria bacterium]|nr:tRNA 2-thiouridine(34) synthase MnmA [Gammaproteobacteria bacterium]